MAIDIDQLVKNVTSQSNSGSTNTKIQVANGETAKAKAGSGKM